MPRSLIIHCYRNGSLNKWFPMFSTLLERKLATERLIDIDEQNNIICGFAEAMKVYGYIGQTTCVRCTLCAFSEVGAQGVCVMCQALEKDETFRKRAARKANSVQIMHERCAAGGVPQFPANSNMRHCNLVELRKLRFRLTDNQATLTTQHQVNVGIYVVYVDTKITKTSKMCTFVVAQTYTHVLYRQMALLFLLAALVADGAASVYSVYCVTEGAVGIRQQS